MYTDTFAQDRKSANLRLNWYKIAKNRGLWSVNAIFGSVLFIHCTSSSGSHPLWPHPSTY